MRAIVRWSVDNPVAVNLLFLVLLVAGITVYTVLPREVVPSIDLDEVEINTWYPGGTAEEVERLVTERIEEAIADLEDVGEVRSLSRQGHSMVTAEIALGADPDVVSRRIEVEVRRIRELPAEVEEEPTVVLRRSAFPVLIVNVAGAADPAELKRWVDRIRRRIVEIHGVVSVDVAGLTEPEIWVECDPVRLAAHDLTTAEVVAAVERWAVNVPGGSTEDGASQTVMRTVGHPTDGVRSLEDAPLRPGSSLKLADVARLREARERPLTYSRFNGQPSVNLYVQKGREGNAVLISEKVRELLAELADDLPAGVEVHTTADTAEYVRTRFRTVYQSGLMAITIILAILYLLLNGRVALMTALGVPAAVSGAVATMAFTDLSLNLFTLFAFILVLGLVVDDAIIIAENIYRRIENGEPPLQAAREGAAEVAWPVTVTVLTTMAAFLPMVFLPGVMGRYMAIVPLVVAVTLGFSLFEALVILPSHVAEASRGGPPPKPPAERHGSLFYAVRDRYRRLLASALAWRHAVLAGAVAVTAVALAVAWYRMPFVLLDAPDIPVFLARIEAPQSAPLEETLRLVEETERVALTLPPEEVRAVIGWVGIFIRPNTDLEFGDHLGELWVELMEYDQRPRKGLEILEELRAKLDADAPEGLGGLTLLPEDGLPTAPDVEVHLLGEDWPALRRAADRLEGFLAAQPGVTDVRDDDLPGQPERRVRLDPERAALYGVDTRSLGLELQAALEGIEAASFRRGDEEVEIVVKLPEHGRLNGGFELERLQVPARMDGGGGVRLVSLSDVATIEEGRGRLAVRRHDRERAVTITAEVDEDVQTPTAVQAAIDREFGAGRLGSDVRLAAAGKSEELEQVFTGVAKAFAVAMLFIYFMLGTLFRSFLQPFAIMLTIPVGIVGVVLGFLVLGRPIDVMALVGTSALAGIVVNDSLVLVDFVNARRRAGATRRQAILEAGEARFRPIVLTTVTTVGGLLPLAMTTTGQAAFLSPMADAICWGLSLATLLTLVVVPCAYAVVDDLASAARRLLGSSPGEDAFASD